MQSYDTDKKSTGALLVNTGTPESPTIPDIKAYLARFLSDRRIVNLPAWLWQPLLHAIVLNLRSKKTLVVYQRIWTAEGSPYTLFMQEIEDRLRQRFSVQGPNDVTIAVAHRYGLPSMYDRLKEFQRQGVGTLVVLPLYPQQARATTFSVADELDRVLSRLDYQPNVHFIEHYYQHEGYIGALAEQISKHLNARDTLAHIQAHKATDRQLLLSYHSIPLKDLRHGDAYQTQVEATSVAITQHLGLDTSQWCTVYQSRFEDTQRWLGPFLLPKLTELLVSGTRDFSVIAPGFAVDCTETLDNICHHARAKLYAAAAAHGINAADIRFDYLPALSASKAQIELLCDLITKEL
ncbi:MAG: ferrochelatase [Coriobacteriales bacterium]|jgi:ferrochelatase|nr:ferrochelatase [Coriobacteriales bacterium]